jgi:hypothetical protein
MIPVKEAQNPQLAKDNYEYMKKVREEINQIDLSDTIEEID